MEKKVDPISRLIQELHKLPTVGLKTATRLAFHMLKLPISEIDSLCQAIREIKEKIQLCTVCCMLTETPICSICKDPKRDEQILCVVAQPSDVLSIEKTSTFRGKYHVLHGILSPLENMGPDRLKIKELLERCRQSTQSLHEIILSTSPNVEGEATATYLYRLLKPLGYKISRIASGLPIGGEIEYADGLSIAKSIEIRREM